MANATQEHRRRLAERGFQRVEIAAPGAHSDLLRRVAQALAQDDERATRLRAVLHDLAADRSPLTFQEWLAMLADDGSSSC
jgi:hypothetical protein